MAAPASGGLFAQLRTLSGQAALYGSADVAAQLINVLLTPLFVYYLSPEDTGVIASLLLLSAVARFLFRLGLDAGFLRVYYDQEGEEARRALVGTVVLFAALSGALLLLGLALLAPWLGAWLLAGARRAALLVMLALADAYAGSFLFVPLHLMRIEGRVRPLALLLTARNVANTGLKVVLVTQGYGVGGVLLSDLLATVLLALVLLPLVLRRARLTLQRALLREVLAFGLPKAPHGILLQLLNLADRWLLVQMRGLGVAGIYDKGYALGAGVKFALAAFEPAWQPFVFSRLKDPEARATLPRVAGYAFAFFVAVALAVAVFGREGLLLLTCTNAAFWPGAAVVPVVALAYLLHGLFLLTSIGIGIEKRTAYYPVITALAAGANLAANLALIPAFGMLGAAWATVLGYAVMAAAGHHFSQKVFPLPFDGARAARLLLAGGATWALSLLVPAPAVAPLRHPGWSEALGFLGALLPALLGKAGVLAVFPVLVWLLGGVTAEERTWLRARLRR